MLEEEETSFLLNSFHIKLFNLSKVSKKEGIGKVSLLGFSFDSVFYGLLLVFRKGGEAEAQSMGSGNLKFFFRKSDVERVELVVRIFCLLSSF